MVSLQDVQKTIANRIDWDKIPEDMSNRYKRGFIWASEVAVECPDSVPKKILQLAMRVNRGMTVEFAV